jgi:ABC-type sugar transport system substrate-binding protein
MKRVLITFAAGRLALGIIRALKAAPEPIHVIGIDLPPSKTIPLEKSRLDVLKGGRNASKRSYT